MRHHITLAISLFVLTSAAHAATSPCAEKKQDIEREISYATQHNNQNRINGLKKALSEVQAHCSDDQLRASHQKKITEQRHKVAERKHELAEAKAKGDADKISKKHKKLTEAEHELKTLEARDY